jgi:2,3-bisphosphoglycerate-independent phosphoglycerate mutase
VDLSGFEVRFRFASGAGHRAALALKGKGLGSSVSSNDPKKEGVAPLQVRPASDRPEDKKTANVCNEFVRQSTEILSDHPLNRKRLEAGQNPANVVLIRGAGEMGHFEPFGKRYELSGSVIAAATLISGIGKVIGLEHVPVKGATGSADSNLEGKVQAALHELGRKDFVLLNIKGADEAGHDGLVQEKRAFIERIDAVLAPFVSLNDCITIVCADHSTPCAVKDHSADPVPVVIRGDGVRTDDIRTFDEFSCAGGGLSRIRGGDLMPIALDLIDKAHKYGA